METNDMDPMEIQTRAMIAAALITSHAVEIPSLPRIGRPIDDPAAERLRALTEYIFQAIVRPQPAP
jgi:hypothetical protein